LERRETRRKRRAKIATLVAAALIMVVTPVLYAQGAPLVTLFVFVR
jgi:predicted nucleic acid-binding Zn ribbon protein